MVCLVVGVDGDTESLLRRIAELAPILSQEAQDVKELSQTV